eukprot:750564-Hanusia_phi.AAC.1
MEKQKILDMKSANPVCIDIESIKTSSRRSLNREFARSGFQFHGKVLRCPCIRSFSHVQRMSGGAMRPWEKTRMFPDYYSVLGVPKGTDLENIRKSYKKLVLRYHPDKNTNNKNAKDMFLRLQEAYSVLSDPALKAEYDEAGFGSKGPLMSNSARFQQPEAAPPWYQTTNVPLHQQSAWARQRTQEAKWEFGGSYADMRARQILKRHEKIRAEAAARTRQKLNSEWQKKNRPPQEHVVDDQADAVGDDQAKSNPFAFMERMNRARPRAQRRGVKPNFEGADVKEMIAVASLRKAEQEISSDLKKRSSAVPAAYLRVQIEEVIWHSILPSMVESEEASRAIKVLTSHAFNTADRPRRQMLWYPASNSIKKSDIASTFESYFMSTKVRSVSLLENRAGVVIFRDRINNYFENEHYINKSQCTSGIRKSLGFDYLQMDFILEDANHCENDISSDSAKAPRPKFSFPRMNQDGKQENEQESESEKDESDSIGPHGYEISRRILLEEEREGRKRAVCCGCSGRVVEGEDIVRYNKERWHRKCYQREIEAQRARTVSKEQARDPKDLGERRKPFSHVSLEQGMDDEPGKQSSARSRQAGSCLAGEAEDTEASASHYLSRDFFSDIVSSDSQATKSVELDSDEYLRCKTMRSQTSKQRPPPPPAPPSPPAPGRTLLDDQQVGPASIMRVLVKELERVGNSTRQQA